MDVVAILFCLFVAFLIRDVMRIIKRSESNYFSHGSE